MKNKIVAIFLSLVALLSFAPKTYADDPCSSIDTPPLLYQINRTPTQATLFFTPINNDQVTNYTILYGLKPEDERHSLTVNQGVSSGAISYTVNDLQAGVPYFYKVRGSTPCTDSPWSSWQGDNAVVKGSSVVTPGIPVTGPETIFGLGAFSLMMIISGFGLFAFSKRRN